MGAEFVVESLEELCDLMCNNVIPKKKEKRSMKVTVNIDVNNMITEPEHGFLVVTNDNGKLWRYGLYDTEKRAQAAVSEFPEMRFMVEVAR